MREIVHSTKCYQLASILSLVALRLDNASRCLKNIPSTWIFYSDIQNILAGKLEHEKVIGLPYGGERNVDGKWKTQLNVCHASGTRAIGRSG